MPKIVMKGIDVLSVKDVTEEQRDRLTKILMNNSAFLTNAAFREDSIEKIIIADNETDNSLVFHVEIMPSNFRVDDDDDIKYLKRMTECDEIGFYFQARRIVVAFKYYKGK